MSSQCIYQRVFRGNYCAIAFSAMFALHSPVLLAEGDVQSTDGLNASNSRSGSQNSATKVMGFTMPKNALDFPAWPVKQVVVKDVPPPPPLGPYMSTALNNEQAGKPHFGSMMSIPVPDFEDAPMTSFSPDLPWPGDNAGVNRWAPDNGYVFVVPNVRPSQPLFNHGSNQGNVKPSNVNPQRQGNYYSRPPMPASMYNKAMNNRPMYNGPVMRAPNVNYLGPNSGTNYYTSANQPRRNLPMQQRNLPVNQNNGRNNSGHYSNGRSQHPQMNTGYNRSAYGVTRGPQMMPPSGHQR